MSSLTKNVLTLFKHSFGPHYVASTSTQTHCLIQSFSDDTRRVL